MRSGKTTKLWGFEGCTRTERADEAGQSAGDIVELSGAGVVTPNCSVTRRARNGAVAAYGKFVPDRLDWMKSRRAVWPSGGACAHGAARCRGGARMDCARTQVSMMIMGAPQCGQTKVG
jgi:hypothetical protein